MLTPGATIKYNEISAWSKAARKFATVLKWALFCFQAQIWWKGVSRDHTKGSESYWSIFEKKTNELTLRRLQPDSKIVFSVLNFNINHSRYLSTSFKSLMLNYLWMGKEKLIISLQVNFNANKQI